MNHLPFCFRGTRDYVLGVDLLDTLLDGLDGGPVHNLDYVVKHPCRNQGFRVLPRAGAEPAQEMLALGTFQDASRDLLILPDGPPVSERKPCDEATLAQSYLFTPGPHPEVQVVVAQSGASLARHLVIAFKYLLNTQVVEKPQHYFFTRLRLNSLTLDDFTLRFQRKFAGQFYEGCILHQGEAVGSIYFSGGAR